MTVNKLLKDLVVLTADKNARFTVQGVLKRCHSLGIRQISSDYYLHPGKDPGILHTAHDFLRSFSRSYAHALVLMDREGSGQEEMSRVEMEEKIETAMSQSGWGDRASVVVIDPELDIWVWSDSPHVDHELGWSGHVPNLRSWLRNRGLLGNGGHQTRTAERGVGSSVETNPKTSFVRPVPSDCRKSIPGEMY